MRTQRVSGRRALASFTLVELLVVISIIALLAGLLFPAAAAAQKAAKKAQTAVLLQGIKMGVAAYQNEYGRLPQPDPDISEDTQYKSDSDDFKNIIAALMGSNAADINPRQVSFVDLQSKDFRGSDPAQEVVDGFKNPIYMVLNYNYDNEIDSTQISEMPPAVRPRNNIRGDVVLWSQGPAKEVGNMTPSDLVATWK